MPTDEQHPDRNTADIDYLAFTAKDYLLALPYHHIIQIVDAPVCTAMPNMPPHVRGAIDFMGEAVPLIDTRVRLSLPSFEEETAEFVRTFMIRKQDHLNWIDKLVDAVENDRKITVEKDPHKCAFGRWYDTFKPNTLALLSYMHRFDKPHQAIHHLAVRAEELIRGGNKDQARQIIEEAKSNELVRLLQLFDGFEEQMRLSYQEYAVMINCNGRNYSISVDSIRYFEKMDSMVREIPVVGTISRNLIHGIGRKKVGDTTEDVIILDIERFLEME